MYTVYMQSHVRMCALAIDFLHAYTYTCTHTQAYVSYICIHTTAYTYMYKHTQADTYILPHMHTCTYRANCSGVTGPIESWFLFVVGDVNICAIHTAKTEIPRIAYSHTRIHTSVTYTYLGAYAYTSYIHIGRSWSPRLTPPGLRLRGLGILRISSLGRLRTLRFALRPGGREATSQVPSQLRKKGRGPKLGHAFGA